MKKVIMTGALGAALFTCGTAITHSASSVAVATQSLSVDDFRNFSNPDFMLALYSLDMGALNLDKPTALWRLSIMVEALAAPDAWYRIGQDMEAYLDPLLAPRIRGLMMTDRRALDMAAGTGLGVVAKVFQSFAAERQSQQSNGVLDPLGELAAITNGLLNGVSPMTELSATSSADAKRLMLIARDDPDTFLRIYEGMRTFVNHY